jgi:cytochrome P450
MVGQLQRRCSASPACVLGAPGPPTTQSRSSPTGMPDPVKLSLWVALKGALRSSTFHDFMMHVRHQLGDAVYFDLRPVLPLTYVLMGKAANKAVLSELDPSLEQILQELINVLPVSARVPAEVDVELQKKVAQLFSNAAVVNERLPSFRRTATQMRDRWLEYGQARGSKQREQAQQSVAAQQQQQQTQGGQASDDGGLEVFVELSEFVLRADLEVLYGRRFTEQHAPRLVARFGEWVQNVANGQLVGFFDELGELLRDAIADRKKNPEEYANERSVLQVYLESGALERLDDESIVGLLSMTLMAAVFNTQVSLAWILVHLYSEPALLRRAREEIDACPDLDDFAQLQELSFLNSCIDEAVRLHTMLPGNTVLRKTRRELQLGSHSAPTGSILWLYPNAVHKDSKCARDCSPIASVHS